MAAFGVYFGCSSAYIAVCRDEKVQVIANDSGDRGTPAVVAFTDHDQTVGLPAKQNIFRNPANTICNVKRLLGRSYDDAGIQDVNDSKSVKILNNGGNPSYQVMYKEKSCTFTPVEIATVIYEKMREMAINNVHDAKSRDAVFAIPLNFDEKQKEAVREAAVKAGFNVLRLISEPAAALLAYDIGQVNTSETCYVLVFRVGHQSLDITIVDVNSGMYRVVASHSDPNVGGHVLDKLLVEHLANEFKRQHRADIRGNNRAIGQLLSAVSTCKHILSNLMSSQCSVESLYDGIDFNCSLTRSRLEMIASNFLYQCLNPLDELLAKANLSKASINKVIMCGGSTKMPLMQQQIRDYFPEAELLSSITPDEVIAVGTAIQAGMLSGKNKEEVDQFSSTCDFPCLSADIVVQVGSGKDLEEMVILKEFTPIPVRRQTTFRLSPNETTFCLHLMQRSSDKKETTPLAKIVMRNLPEGAAISGVFHMRHDGSLHATCTESETQQTQDVIVESSHT